MKIKRSNCGLRALLLPLLTSVLIISLLVSCSKDEMVKEYFDSHGMNYPVDVVGISLFGLDYAGIESDEMTAPGAREFVEEGIMFIKQDLQKQNPAIFMNGAAGIKADKAVLYRAETEDVGLMVRITGYGQGEPAKEIESRIEWVGLKERFWKYENYAYYVRNELYMWEFGGWLFN
jgi:hypothetical protein